MGTHPIFESDFDCLTEIGKAFHYGEEGRGKAGPDQGGRNDRAPGLN